MKSDDQLAADAGICPAPSELEQESAARERVIQNIVYAIEGKPMPHADMAENGIVKRALRGLAALPAQAPKEMPDPPHVREDYRDVWLSGWRAGRAAQAQRGPQDVPEREFGTTVLQSERLNVSTVPLPAPPDADPQG